MTQSQDILMHALIPSARNRPSEDPIFAIHGAALARAAKGEDVIDASLGTLMDEDGGLSVMPTVIRALAQVNPAKAAAYAPIAGERGFNQAVVQEVFGPAGLAQDSLCVATAGGTGALHHAVVNFLERGESLLTTDYYWGPYSTIADQAGRGVQTFRMFNAERRFDLAALEQGLHELAGRQERILLILNFPCHNPTGYSLGGAEWRDVVQILRGVDRSKPMAVVLDLAYAKFGAPGTDAWVHHIADLAQDIPILAAWSASKSFAQYGARIGGLVVAHGDAEERTRIGNALSYTCRGTWSNCNHLGMLAITELLSHPELRASVDRDRDALLSMLGERVEIFNREAVQHGLHYPRYEGGFFVTIFTSDPIQTAQRCQADGVFVVPIRGAVRVALCATPKAQVARLVASLASGVQGLQGAIQ
ncbi:MAG: aminotransferase class I/II-fold pyridoxal phosphate-dependent enzyme [Planctomycetes bacterium]|nr:aminotransferase class I/II-fold pyridoxal phosphate-dependent enzyme [Planctomycetota bacterium]HPF15669.1 aminotransferase class I/II-fold pyridoxal phosphate-dependent enzyme [Planctomycetota bacterium]HRV81920.1 aminotransferase class I/II-fold pyridoxal phosphate-dependent enzyme [Planctomycetota bacterium]